MRCEIIGSTCALRGRDCANCRFATEALLNTVDNIKKDYPIISTVNIERDFKERELTAKWAMNPIAKVSKGELCVAEFDL